MEREACWPVGKADGIGAAAAGVGEQAGQGIFVSHATRSPGPSWPAEPRATPPKLSLEQLPTILEWINGLLKDRNLLLPFSGEPI